MKRTVLSIVGFIVLLLVLWGAFHVMIPWVNPDQEAPEDHATAACWTCHIVTSSAELIELEEDQ